ncbi:MAG TPA: hypothetical protein VF376_13600 [Thermoanaerobaculia bacterium]
MTRDSLHAILQKEFFLLEPALFELFFLGEARLLGEGLKPPLVIPMFRMKAVVLRIDFR